MKRAAAKFLLLVFVIQAHHRTVESFAKDTILPAKCGTTIARSVGQILVAHSGVESGTHEYTTAVTGCRVEMQAAAADQFLSFGFGTDESTINIIGGASGNCTSGAYVNLYDSDGTTPLFSNLCGDLTSSTLYTSTADKLVLEIESAGGAGMVINFTAHYTSFYIGNCTTEGSIFACANGRCVDSSSRCDTTLINNCGDNSDNAPGPPGNCTAEEVTGTSAQTTTPTPPVTEPADLTFIAYIAGGLVGALLLYWLLVHPGYLIWRCSFWRHLNFCKKHGCCQTGEAYKVKDSLDKSKFAKTNGKGNPPNSNGGSPYDSSSSSFSSYDSPGSGPKNSVHPERPQFFNGLQRNEAHIWSY